MKAKPIAAVWMNLSFSFIPKILKNTHCWLWYRAAFCFSIFKLSCPVDLSLASLAYAQRKSNELSFTNIDYLQADILHLHQLGKEFDIIESVGVLHHMDEPMAGWRVLVDLLKPGGLMKIGLYSEFA